MVVLYHMPCIYCIITPPRKSKTKPSLTRSQAGGGLKGNDQKKYTIEEVSENSERQKK